MKKILIVLSAYTFLVMLVSIYSLWQAMGTGIRLSPQALFLNIVITLPILIFSVLAFLYLRKLP